MRRRGITTVLLAAVLSTPAAAQPDLCELQVLVDPLAAPRDALGTAVDLDGDILAAGVPGAADSGDPGTVRVYRRTGDGWIVDAVLRGTSGRVSDGFGAVLDLDGATLIVGAPGLGRAHVFARRGGRWVAKAILTPSDARSPLIFGVSVALDGDTAIVGATGGFPSGPGAAYVYVRRGARWIESARLVRDAPATDDRFGAAVAVSGDVALVGATRADGIGNAVGSVTVFRRTSSVWAHDDVLAPADLFSGDNFGNAIGLRDGLAVIGAFAGDSEGARPGAAYVFREIGGVFVQEARFSPPDDTPDQEFGFDVATDGTAVFVGAPFDPALGPETGAAWLHRIADGAWDSGIRIIASDASSSSSFGAGVVVDGDRAVVGAPGADVLKSDEGAVYVLTGIDAVDCNRNGVADACDLASGDSADRDADGTPDECAD